MTAGRARSRRCGGPVPALAAALLALTVAACDPAAGEEASPSTAAQPDLQREPRQMGEPLPDAGADGLWLPYQVDALALVDPPWPVAAAEELHGVFLAPAETDGVLELRAVDAEGTLLWTAQRPATCTGFVLTTTSTGQDVAVLLDVGGPGGEGTTASAYDLRTGAAVWGPVPVPGPHRGPGLVFGAAAGALGEADETVALDADSGEQLAVPSGAWIVGEYAGVLLVADEEHLLALGPGGAGPAPQWQVPIEELTGTDPQEGAADQVAATAGTDPGEGVALLDVGTGRRVLIDLTDGTVLADGLRDARTDPATGARVLLDEFGLHGLDEHGTPTWSAAAGPDAQLQAVGGALVYLLDSGSVRVHNVLTGDVAVGYDAAGSGTIAVPALISPTGAALLTAGQAQLLATTRPADPEAR